MLTEAEQYVYNITWQYFKQISSKRSQYSELMVSVSEAHIGVTKAWY